MPNILYNNNSLSRFNNLKNWTKLLFRTDRKLQTTELEEVQDLINNQLGLGFSLLYDSFTVIKGCKIIILNIGNNNYDCLLTDGQIYVEIKNKFYFIDTPSYNFSILKTQSVFIGVNLTVLLSSNENEYNNPQTGGAAFGSLGANRILIKSNIVVQSLDVPIETYPIAVIKPKTNSFVASNLDISDGYPNIVYYKNKELSQNNNQTDISNYIKNLVEVRLYESAGDFISTGLDITINTSTNILTISPGIAYLNGKRIQTNYNNYFKLDPNELGTSNINLNKQYLFYLNDQAEFKYISKTDKNTLLDVPNNSLALAYVVFNNRNNLLLDYSIIPAPTKMPSILDLINLDLSNTENIKQLSELILKTNILGLNSSSLNKDLNGIFTDAFVDLTNTDIFFPNYQAAILPAIQSISLPFISNNINNRNFQLDNTNSNIIVESTLNDNNEVVPYWSTINGTTIKLFNTPLNITGGINIPVTTTNSIIVSSTPTILYKSDENTFINYSHPNLKNLFKNNASNFVDTPFNNNVYTKPIKVDAYGFYGFQNNIIVEINNVRLTSFNIIKGSLGSINGSLKADKNGAVSFIINIPKLEDFINYNITLRSDVNIGACEITIKDPEESRVIKEQTNTFIDKVQTKYNLINSGIVQPFTITNPIMLKGVECTILDFPSIGNNDVLNIQIVSVDSINRPIETLAVGSLSFNNLQPLEADNPLPKPSIINLIKPVNLSRGTYGIVFSSSIPGIELAGTKAGKSRLLDGKSFFYDPLKTQVLVFNDNWKETTIVDNIACDLLIHKPLGLLSTTVIDINSNQDNPFNIIDINASIEGDISSYIDMFILNESNLYEPINNGYFFFKDPVTKTKLKISIKGTSNTHPIINLDNLNINLISNSKKAVWVSKNQEYESSYTNLTMSVDVYKPDNTNYKFYFSSNKGDSWEELLNPEIEIIDGALNLAKYTFSKTNLNFINLNSELSLRYNLRYKIEFEVSNNEGIPPYFKNIVSITSN